MRNELRNVQLSSSEKNKLIAIYERFKRNHKQPSVGKIGLKIKEIEAKVKKHDKEIKRIFKILKRLLDRRTD